MPDGIGKGQGLAENVVEHSLMIAAQKRRITREEDIEEDAK